jgi:hypothetical protein
VVRGDLLPKCCVYFHQGSFGPTVQQVKTFKGIEGFVLGSLAVGICTGIFLDPSSGYLPHPQRERRNPQADAKLTPPPHAVTAE